MNETRFCWLSVSSVFTDKVFGIGRMGGSTVGTRVEDYGCFLCRWGHTLFRFLYCKFLKWVIVSLLITSGEQRIGYMILRWDQIVERQGILANGPHGI